MSTSASVAVVAEVALLRQGLGLQLRLAGLEVVLESSSVVELLTHLEPGGAQVDTAVALDVGRCDPSSKAALMDAAGPLLDRGTNVVLVGRGDGSAVAQTATITGGPDGAVGGGAARARLVAVTLAEVLDVRDLARLVRALPRHPRSVAMRRPFTKSEFTVHALIAEGYSNAGIASLLGVSRKTVECHVSSVFAKLDLAREGGTYNRRVSAALRWSSADRPAIGADTSTHTPAETPRGGSTVSAPRLALTSRHL